MAEYPQVENPLGTKMPDEIYVSDSHSLRLLVPSDAQRVYDIDQADPDIRSHVGWLDEAFTVDEIAERIRVLREQNSLRYGIVEDGVVMGYSGIWLDFKAGQPRAYDLGYFADVSARGRGLVTAVVKSLMREASRSGEVDEFILFIRDANEESKAVAHRLGFEATSQMFRNKRGDMERRYVHAPSSTVEYSVTVQNYVKAATS